MAFEFDTISDASEVFVAISVVKLVQLIQFGRLKKS